jgi:hypothetical protein
VKRRLALFAFALAAIATIGLGLGTRGAEAAAGPQAHAGGPHSSIVGSAIHFDGTASSGVGLQYFWSFADGTSAEGGRPVKAYGAPGVYRVTLTVQDVTGAQSVAATTATIGGFRNLVPAGCAITSLGQVFCGSTFGSVVPGCSLTIAGWVCPGTIPGPIVTPRLVGTTALFAVSPCTNPNYAPTPFCQDRR